jgi:hypothetical protein
MIRSGFSALVLAGVLCVQNNAMAQNNSPGSAAAIGATVAGIVECGQGYSSHELYNVKVSVQEVLRGPAASERLQSAAGEIPAPAADNEYLLASVSFNYKARGKPGLCAHPLRPAQFKAISAAGVEYPRPDFPPPDPPLTGDIKSAETLDGWLVYLVPRADSSPLLYFNVDENGGVAHGGNLWFKLGAE